MVRHVLSGAVQMSPAQHGSPVLPHAPPWQPPAVQAPCMPGHIAWAATHVDTPTAWMQHPPLEQVFPSQHGCPEPPHAVHAPIEQASVGSLQ
jgi:hypothetical protein